MCSITVNQPHPWSFRPSYHRRRHTTPENIHITCHCGSASCHHQHYYYHPRRSPAYPLTGSIYNINNYGPATTTPTPYYPPYDHTTGTRTKTRTHDTTLYHYKRTFPSSFPSSPTPRPAPRPQLAALHRPRCCACERHTCRCVGRYSYDMDRGWVDEWDAWRERERREVERFVPGWKGPGKGCLRGVV